MSATRTRTPLVWQGSLFGTGTPRPDAGFHGVARTQLDDTSWVDVVPGWLSGADELFTALLHRLAWQSNEMPMYGQLVRQPRLSAWWRLDDEQVRQPLLATLAEAAGRHYGVTFESIGANLYRDGRDSVAWHGDRIGRGNTQDTMVAIIVLGAPRALLLRPRGGGGPTLRHDLGHGDLLVMGGSCQRTWEHAVPKTAKPVGPRISVQFRPRGVR
jgi:alkylated DNA repair dioxygenase AlkB